MLLDWDPQEAWSVFEPDAAHPWNPAAAAHLYRRAGFAANWRELHEAASADPADLVRRLVRAAPDPAQQQQRQAMAQAMVNTGEPQNLAGAWMHQLLASSHQLREKMTLFWHGHFATSGDKVRDAGMLQQQHELLRREALGSFAELVRGVSRDPAMLIYLDSNTNRKAHPNENYARELLELFCLGEGNYSETDIRELARCFTGWRIKRNQFSFNRFDHDAGRKSIFGESGEFGGEEAVELVLRHEAAPYFIAGKLFRFLVMDEPAPTRELLAPLARTLREADWNLQPVLEQILSSRLFFSPAARAAKIRSPIEFACGLLRALDGSTNSFRLAELTADVGQALFFPPNVKGWDGGRTWINSSTLVGRSNLVHAVLRHESTRFGGGALAEYFPDEVLSDAESLIDRLQLLLLAAPLTSPAREKLTALARSDSLYDSKHLAKILQAFAAAPEFQLG